MKTIKLVLLLAISTLTLLHSCSLEDLQVPTTNKNLVSISGKSNGSVSVGQSDTFTLDLINDGTSEITINDIDFSQNDENAFSFENGKPSFPVKIQQNKKFSIKLRFTPTKNKIYTAILAVTGIDPSDTKTYTLKFTGQAPKGSIKSVPDFGIFTGCDFPKAIRDLTDIDENLYTDYITNHFKLQVVGIDSLEGWITFRIKRCDNTNFKNYASCAIFEENPVYSIGWNSPVDINSNDTACTIQFRTKFHGKDTKRYIATIQEFGSNAKYYCTKEITLSW